MKIGKLPSLTPLLLVVIMCTVAFAQETTPTLTLATQTATDCGSACLPITVENFTSITWVELYIDYDSSCMASTGFDLGYLTGAFVDYTEDMVYIYWSDYDNPLTVPDGETLISVCFSGLSETACAVTFRETNWILDENGLYVDANYIDGSLSCTQEAPCVTTVTYPNGGEVWTTNDTTIIEWTYTNGGQPDTCACTATISVSYDGGATWIQIAAGITGNSYPWIVPGNPSTNCLIKVCCDGAESICDISDAPFTIQYPPPVITSVDPNEATQGDSLTVTVLGQFTILGQPYEIRSHLINGSDTITTVEVTKVSNTRIDVDFAIPEDVGPSFYSFSIGNYDLGEPVHTATLVDGFTINPAPCTTTVISPNGGQVFYQGDTTTIFWTFTHGAPEDTCTCPATVSLSIDGGATWTEISSGYSGFYAPWSVPYVSSTNCLIRVCCDGPEGPICDISDAPFTIQEPPPPIMLTLPDIIADDCDLACISIWVEEFSDVGSLQLVIKWDTLLMRCDGVFPGGLVDANSFIENGQALIWWMDTGDPLSLPNDAALLTLCFTMLSGTPGPVEFTVNDCQIKDEHGNELDVVYTDGSLACTSGPPCVTTILSPNGGEVWTGNELALIEWTFTNGGEPDTCTCTATVSLSTDGGATWSEIATGITDGALIWTVPNDPSTNCLIKVCCAGPEPICDVSDAPFTIEAPPPPVITSVVPNEANEGESLTVAITGENTEFGAGSGPTVVELTKGPESITSTGVTVYDATNLEAAFVILMGTAAGDWTISVYEADDPFITVTLTDGFTIHSVPMPCTTTVTYPNEGEGFLQGDTTTITWTYTNGGQPDTCTCNATVSLSIDGGATWTEIATGVTGNSTPWSVPYVVSTNCLIRVCCDGAESICDVSDAPFTILAPVRLTCEVVIGDDCDNVCTAITARNLSNVGRVELSCSYDPACMTCTGIDEGNLAGAITFCAEGNILLIWEDFANPLSLTDDDTLCWLCFAGPSGPPCTIHFSATSNVLDAQGDTIPLSTTDGSVACDGGCCVMRGDVNHDGAELIDIADLLYLIDYMFQGGPVPVCFDEADIDASGTEPPDISDLLYLIDFMFQGGPAPTSCP